MLPTMYTWAPLAPALLLPLADSELCSFQVRQKLKGEQTRGSG